MLEGRCSSKFFGTFSRLYSHVHALSHLSPDSPTHAPPPAGPASPRPPQATADRPLPWTRESTGRYLDESRCTSNTVASTLVRRTMERRRGGHSSARGHHPVQSRPAPLSSAATDLPALLVRPQINLPHLSLILKNQTTHYTLSHALTHQTLGPASLPASHQRATPANPPVPGRDPRARTPLRHPSPAPVTTQSRSNNTMDRRGGGHTCPSRACPGEGLARVPSATTSPPKHTHAHN